MLPQKLDLPKMMTAWAAQLNPLIDNVLIKGNLLTGIVLSNGTTQINHKLGRKLIGWIVVGQDAAAEIYDNQISNQHPELTLSLTSNAAVTVALWVF
jgi:hypothetical protein